jgi:uncharacterized membrane protein
MSNISPNILYFSQRIIKIGEVYALLISFTIYHKLFLEVILPLHSSPPIPPLLFILFTLCAYPSFWGRYERTGSEWGVIADVCTAHVAYISGTGPPIIRDFEKIQKVPAER